MARRSSTTKGFKRTATLLGDRIRRAGESRGFAVSRVLTHWSEIVGEDLARICRPVEVSYGRSGFGATLSVLTTGAQAPMLEMQKEQLRARVNAVYGYNAISRVRITQTAKTGFAEGQATFLQAQGTREVAPPDPATVTRARAVANDITDSDLRSALERLGQNVLSTSKE
ncbi:MAG: DUF721 domain-containing protein [Aestuariivita sp.]|uniref:DUF721 domain-containing protein n=1 Tax=Aestuariivita sp. TaxID=1872407 RepID=UPI003BB03E50